MKQQANVQGVRCPVNCPVCHHQGTEFPARFRRIALPASGLIDRITNKSNHVLFLLSGTVHVNQGRDNIHLQAGQCMFFARNEVPAIQTVTPSDIVWLDFSTASCSEDTTRWPRSPRQTRRRAIARYPSSK